MAHFIYSYLLLAIRKSVATNVMLLAITRISEPCESKTLCKSFMYIFLAIEDLLRDSWILLPKIILLKRVSLHQYFQFQKGIDQKLRMSDTMVVKPKFEKW